MEICVCGWYFNEELLDVLTSITDTYPVSIVAHRDKLPEKYKGKFNYHIRENTGLEYGAYDYFLKNIWSGGDVLFLHDDMTIQPIIQNFEIVPPKILFDTVAKFKQDLLYIFRCDNDRQRCFDIHGRVMFASSRFLNVLLDRNGGFPWDKNNDGYIKGPQPDYCENYNWAVYELRKFWEPLTTFDRFIIGPVIIPSFDYRVRGSLNY